MQSVLSSEEFLEVWKKEAEAWADVIFASVPVRGPVLSGKLKEEAVEVIMRVVGCYVDTPDKEKALWKNLDAIKEYTSDLVDRTVAENWERMTASR